MMNEPTYNLPSRIILGILTAIFIIPIAMCLIVIGWNGID